MAEGVCGAKVILVRCSCSSRDRPRVLGWRHSGLEATVAGLSGPFVIRLRLVGAAVSVTVVALRFCHLRSPCLPSRYCEGPGVGVIAES